MSHRFLCLINPRSGGGRGALIARLFRELRPESFTLDVIDLQRDVPLPPRQELDEKYTDVVVAGGDGTFSSILPILSGSDITVHLLALGTGNDLARELRVAGLWSGSAASFIRKSIALATVPVALWSARLVAEDGGERIIPFVNYLSFGWDGLVVAEFDRLREAKHALAGRWGPWGNRGLYCYSAVRAKRSQLPAFEVRGLKEVRTFPAAYRSVIAANIGSVMGLGRLAPQSNSSDDHLEILPISSVMQFAELLLPHRLRSNGFRSGIISGEQISIRFQKADLPLPIQVDGEAVPPFAAREVLFSVSGSVRVKSQATI